MFPPHKKVVDIKDLPSFNLRKEGVQVGVMEWIGDMDHFSQLNEVWVQLDGIPPSGLSLLTLSWWNVVSSCYT
jgi:hypothetical protein